MTLEDGVPRAVQEWEHSSNFERMIFYEMAEKFMEFEAEEEQQIQKMKLLASCSQFQTPAPKPTKPSVSPAPESGQQQVYIPKKSASKSRQPRRRQRRPPSTSTPGAPREIPAEAVHQYAEIMEGLDTSWEEDEEEKKEQRASRDPQDQEDGVFPDPTLTQYIDQLCDDEEFVCKVEAVIHPQFMAQLLSPEKNQDPMDLVEELEEELNLTPSQLTEKRLLALTEEEREPSMYPTSHSDSTPSQSEEEDEVSGSGKGEDTSCQTMKRPSGNKVIRTNQIESPASIVLSPLPSNSHHKLGNINFLPKGVKAVAISSLPKYGNHESQEGNPLSSLNATDDGETQHLPKQEEFRDHDIRISPQAQRVKSEATANVTRNSRFSGKQGGSKAEEGIPRACTTKYPKQNGNQEDNVTGQVVVPKVAEQNSRLVTVQFPSGNQLVWNNVESDNNKYAKQCGSQLGEARCLKKARAFQEIRDNASEEMDCDNQDRTKILFEDHVAGGNALKLIMNTHKELNVDHTEKVTDQSQVQETGSNDTLSKKEHGCKDREVKLRWDNQMKQSQGHIHHTCEKQDSCQGQVRKDQCQLQVTWKGPKSVPTVAGTHSGIIDTCCQSLTRQGNLTLVSPVLGTELDSPKAKSQKPEAGWKQTNTTNIRDNSPAKNSDLSTDKLPLQSQSAPIKQGGQPSDVQPMLETNQKADLKSYAELTRGNRQLLTSADSCRIATLEDQVTHSEHLPCFTFLMLKSSSLKAHNNPEKGQMSQWSCTEQCKVTPSVENCPDVKQVINLNPSNPNFSDSVVTAEAEGDNCGPGGDHTSVSTGSAKTVPTFPPQLILQDSSSTQRYESNVSLSSKFPSLENDTKNLCKVEGGGFHEKVILENVRLPELPGARMETVFKYNAKGEEEEEDEEMSTFSSMLASKLSLSIPCGHGPLPMEQGDTCPSSPTDTKKQGAKTRHSIRAQMLHNSSTLPSKNMEAKSALHHSHKRKSNTSGIRRSKRLRNQ